ncbi:MAG: apolipoprotein N-acyltransferase [Candidatus Omnitrophica bacterium]|nr:apolipoprotein N-acyltransferase [Candidatus Omnitrophota bacterium]
MIQSVILSVLSAALLFCSFPPLQFGFLAWVALIPLFYVLDRARTRWVAFGWGYLTGFLFFLAVLQWIHYVTTIGLIFLSAYLALYFGLFGTFYRWSDRFRLRFRIFMLSAAWVILEYLRGAIFTGFNWGSIGHSQTYFKDLVRFAAVAGVPAISFVVVCGNFFIRGLGAALVEGIQIKRNLIGALVFAFLVWLGGAIAYRIPYKLPPKTIFLNVALIQPNTSLATSADPSLREGIVHQELEMSRKALKKRPDLIIWPETSFPGFYWEKPELVAEIKTFARENKVSLLIGAITKEGDKYFNSALLIWPNGEIVKTYNKRHLVMLGEYIPFRKGLPFLASLVPIDDFSPGTESSVFELPNGVKFSVLICFEDTVPSLATRYVYKGADFLVNMTNDAWFRDVGQQKMHLDNASFRAVENRRPLLRATNTGESCMVERNGIASPCVQDDHLKKVDIQGVASVRFPIFRQPTVFRKYGDMFILFCLFGILLVPVLVKLMPPAFWNAELTRLSLRGRNRKVPSISTLAKVLIIDDDRALHMLLKHVLGSKGFEVVSAMTGADGLALARTYKPDIIILDVVMPEMKGHEVCARLKSDSVTAPIPVLFLTALNSLMEINTELLLGAAGHLAKPVDSVELIKEIRKILGLSKEKE